MDSNKALVDFVLITALEEERDAVLVQLPGYKKLPKDDTDTHTYYEAELKTNRPDEAVYKVLITCLAGMGPVKAAEKAIDVYNKWKPRGVLLVGIGGGVKGEVSLGDVLVPDQIANTVLGKIKPEKSATVKKAQRSRDPIKNEVKTTREVRWTDFPVNANLLDQAVNYPHGWQQHIKVDRPKTGSPIRYIGTVVSGGDVVADAATIALYKRHWPKLIGVEMEGGAVASALHSRTNQPAFLMIRGVSDLADSKKNTRATKIWRPYACAAAAAYAIKLLEDGPIAGNAPRRRPSRAQAARKPVNKYNPLAFSLAIDEDGKNHVQFETSKILKGIEEIGKRQERIQASLSSKFDPHELLRMAEADNPGISFKSESTAAGTTYIIGPKPGVQDLEVGHLEFPTTTEAGRRGLDKFENALDEGIPVVLDPEECQWKSHLKLPWRSISESQGMLRIERQIPDIKIPVKLICQRANRVVAAVALTYGSVVRAGRKTTEVRIAGGQLAGAFVFRFHQDTANSEVTVEVNLGLTSVSHALDTVNLLLAMHDKSSSFAIEFLEKGTKTTGHINDIAMPKDYLLHVKKLLAGLKMINDEFDVDIRFPDLLDGEEEAHILLLSNAIELNGIVREGAGMGNVKTPKSELQNLSGHLKAKKPGTIDIRRKGVRIFMLGHWLEVGEWSTKLDGVEFTSTVEEIELSSFALNPNEDVTLPVSYVCATETFPRWQRQSIQSRRLRQR